MLISAAKLRDEYDGDWHITRMVCKTCDGYTLSLHPRVTVRVECPFCHAFNDVLPVDCIRIVRPADGDFEWTDTWPHL